MSWGQIESNIQNGLQMGGQLLEGNFLGAAQTADQTGTLNSLNQDGQNQLSQTAQIFGAEEALDQQSAMLQFKHQFNEDLIKAEAR